MAMLGEIPRLRGFLRLNGKMSYASQAPWIFTASVRDNILFGQEYDRSRYNKVIKACDLNKVCLLFSQMVVEVGLFSDLLKSPRVYTT